MVAHTRLAFCLSLLLATVSSSTACGDGTGDCGQGVFVLVLDLSPEEVAEEEAEEMSCEDTCEAMFRRESPTDPIFVTPQECDLTPSEAGARLECAGRTQEYECD